MCGFLVTLSKKNISQELWQKAFDSIKHRGPDSSKVKIINNKPLKIKFGFHRLSIVDHKNNQADQPFITEDSILVFNGEIYNYLHLKNKLIKKKNIKFKTKSDTEVLVRYLEAFGLSKTLRDLDGMWSFIWFLKKENKMFIARDRYGEKPLYYYNDNGRLIISSEIKSILVLSKKKFYVNKDASNKFLNYGIINYDKTTLFQGIFQIPPSQYSTLDLKKEKFNLRLIEYFKYKKEVNKFSFEKNSLILKKKLSDSLILRLSNEVKFGILLSGGIDSSIIFAIAKKNILKKKISLFFSPNSNKNTKDNVNISFLENYYKLKINKIHLPKNREIIFKYLKKITWFNDYPLNSIAAINQYLMGKEARKKNIKILISGQGADELFYGYLKYYSFFMFNLIKKGNILSFLKNLYYMFRNSFFNQIKIFWIFKYFGLNFLNQNNFIEKKSLEFTKNYMNFNDLKKRSFFDMNRFSVPTLCHYEDRMYMLSGVETRFPYLNNDLQKFSLSLPDSFKLALGYTKYILRKAFVNELPNKILFRKDKQGFDIGFDSFLKNNKNTLKKKYLNKNSLVIKEKIIPISFLVYFESYYKNFLFQKKAEPLFVFRVLSFEIWLHTFKKYLFLKK